MKNSHLCPKCESRDILRISGEVSDAAGDNSINVGWFNVVKIARYICGNCGFSEEWIENADDIKNLRPLHEPFLREAQMQVEEEMVDVATCAECGSALVEMEYQPRCLWCEENPHE